MRAFWVGIDENGLGAWLGPLVVTGVLAQVTSTKPTAREQPFDGLGSTLLNDSKRLVSHKDVRLGEAWARALLGSGAKKPSDVLEGLVLDGTRGLRMDCPKEALPQCWTVGDEAFGAGDALVQRIELHLDKLRAQGIDRLSVRSVVVCTKRLNLALERGLHRFHLDLHGMETLLLALHAEAAQPIHAICGKVGGMVQYGRFFGPLAGRLHTVLEEHAGVSSYEFPGLGRIEFRRNADATDPLVMIASLVGKYLRELLMGRIGRYYAQADSTLEEPSGYHDPVTRRFVTRTVSLRTQRAIPSNCFLRRGRSGT